jgi:hypothetical protein
MFMSSLQYLVLPAESEKALDDRVSAACIGANEEAELLA